MAFRITGLDPKPFLDLAELSDEAFAARGIVRRVSDGTGFPCRVSLEDVAAGEPVLLLNYEHQPAPTPFRSSHAVYVREGERRRYDQVDDVPALLRSRLLSIRGFDSGHMLIEADVVAGEGAAEAIERFFATPEIAYLHIHYARPGCFAARADRA